jgi:O-antigen ligase
LGSLGAISFCILAAVFIPEVSERFHKAISKVIYFFSVVPVDDPVTAWGGPRVRTWLASVNVIRDNMLFGVGFSGANDILAEYGSILIGEVRTGRVIAVHGGFLKMAIYGGLLNLVLFLIFLCLMISLTVGNFYSRHSLANRCGAYSALVLLMMLIPMNIAADCFGLSLTWMSLSFLIVNSEIKMDLAISHDEISK